MLQFIKKHKVIFLVALIIIIGGGYYGYTKFYGGSTQISYITSTVQKGTIVTSVSSSGQISSSNQVDITPKVSGDVTKIPVVSGQEVKTGQLIAQIDATDAYKTVRDAEANLQSAQLSLDKLKQSITASSITQAQNSVTSAQTTLNKLKVSQPIDLTSAQNSVQNAQANLDKAYSDSFTAISNSFLNLPNIITALDDILYSDQISSSEPSLGSGQINTSALLNSTYETDKSKIMSYQSNAENDYTTARIDYDAVYQDFRNASVYSSDDVIENLLTKTLTADKAIAQAIKSENNYLIAWSDSRTLRNSSVFSQVATYKTNLSTYSGQTNTISSNLSSAQTTIKTDKDAITSANNNLSTLIKNQPLDLAAAEASLKEKQASLNDLMAGVDPLDIKTQELAVTQKRNSLYDAQNSLADYTIRAPFDGVIAAVNLKVGDSTGGSAIVTIVTKQQIAEISLNEVDAAKIKVGMKATMTFDAIDGLEITGKVANIDTIGTVTQGVVTYNVKIVFDMQDDRVKSGMSTNTTIIIDSKTDVLSIESSAIKTDSNGGTYVQILDANGQPQNVTVQIGIANDTNTEIVSGLNEGDKVITNTSSSKTTTTSKSSNVGGLMMGGGGPGN